MKQISKSPSNLHKVPEEVASTLAYYVRTWAAIGNPHENDRKRMEELRDFTLRSLALSCKEGYRLYFPFLLRNITISRSDILSLFQLFGREVDSASLVKSLHITLESPDRTKDRPSKNMKITEAQDQLLMPSESERAQIATSPAQMNYFAERATQRMIAFVFSQMKNLETIVIRHVDAMMFPLVETVNGKMRPLAFTSTLKQLEIFPPLMTKGTLSSTKAIWLLSFLPNLREAILNVSVRLPEGEKYLSEYNQVFKGLSKVKHLALNVSFSHEETDRKTWWGLESEFRKTWKYGNRKNESIFNMLQVAQGLESFELTTTNIGLRSGDRTDVHSPCIASLESSHFTLKHLRTMGINRDIWSSVSFDYHLFKNLKCLLLDLNLLRCFLQGLPVQLPESLEKVYIDHYQSQTRQPSVYHGEDEAICVLLNSNVLEKLTEVGVPRDPININYRMISDPTYRETWKKNRKSLEKLKVFNSGRLRLKLLEPAEIVGDKSKGESCFTTNNFTSPFQT